MRERLEQRLAELRAEYEAGQRVLADLEAKRTNVKETLLRISGAIQVLEELQQASPPAETGRAGEEPSAVGPDTSRQEREASSADGS